MMSERVFHALCRCTVLTLTLLVITPRAIKGIQTDTKVYWTPQNSESFNGSSLSAASEGANSVTKCGHTCSRNASCDVFCYDVVGSLCYVSGMVTSSDLGVISGSQLQCFKECPFNKGYAIYGGHCIKLYMYFTSHANALGVCAADGAHLYHFKSLTKDRQPVIDLLYDNGIDHADVTLSFLWVGATDIVSEGSFVWSDGSPLPVGSDVWVSPLEPNDAGTGEDCARVILPEVKINDGPCSGGARFVCQIDF